jgi:hypothetical protein
MEASRDEGRKQKVLMGTCGKSNFLVISFLEKLPLERLGSGFRV